MEMPFGLYPRFYVKRKPLLFPLIEKYTGQKIPAGTPHGKIIPLYLRLLKTDASFRSEVDVLIEKEGPKLLTVKEKVAAKKEADVNKKLQSNLHGSAEFANAGGLFSTIVSGITNIFGSAKAAAAAKEEGDNLFYQTVLEEQKKDDTGKILIISGVTVALIGIGTVLVLKLRK